MEKLNVSCYGTLQLADFAQFFRVSAVQRICTREFPESEINIVLFCILSALCYYSKKIRGETSEAQKAHPVIWLN